MWRLAVTLYCAEHGYYVIIESDHAHRRYQIGVQDFHRWKKFLKSWQSVLGDYYVTYFKYIGE